MFANLKTRVLKISTSIRENCIVLERSIPNGQEKDYRSMGGAKWPVCACKAFKFFVCWKEQKKLGFLFTKFTTTIEFQTDCLKKILKKLLLCFHNSFFCLFLCSRLASQTANLVKKSSRLLHFKVFFCALVYLLIILPDIQNITRSATMALNHGNIWKTLTGFYKILSSQRLRMNPDFYEREVEDEQPKFKS